MPRIGDGGLCADTCELKCNSRLQCHRRQFAGETEALVVLIHHQQALRTRHLFAKRRFVEWRDRLQVQHARRDTLLFQKRGGFQRAVNAHAESRNRQVRT